MKLQINTENKTVKIDSDILLSELFDALESLFPDGAWEELTLEVNSTISTNWTNSIVIPWARPCWPAGTETPKRWWDDRPWYTVIGGVGPDEPKIVFKTGVFNVEC